MTIQAKYKMFVVMYLEKEKNEMNNWLKVSQFPKFQKGIYINKITYMS